MVLLLGIGYGKYGFPIQFLLIVAAFLAAIIAKRCGYTWDDMIKGIAEKITSSLPSLLVMVCVGAMIASWMVSGTIPMMIYYGIKIIDPQFLFVTAFFVTAVISTFTGTSFGSAGTAGVAIMGIAIALGVPLEIAAGAVVAVIVLYNLVDILRELVYYFLFAKASVSEYFYANSVALEINANKIKDTNKDAADTQVSFANSFRHIAEKLKVDDKEAVSKSAKALKHDNMEIKYKAEDLSDALPDSSASDSSGLF